MTRILYIVIFFTISNAAFAQTNVDSLFNVAINLAKDKDYDLAVDKAKEVVILDSTRNDVKVFIANAYAWNNNYTASKEYINEVYTSNPSYHELYDTWLNVLLWNNEYKDLLSTVKVAQNNGYDDEYNIALKKALAYQGLQLYNAGFNYLNQNKALLDSSTINQLYLELKKQASKNTITGYYSLDLFDKNTPTPQHLAYIDYSLSNHKNTYILRFNYANRFDFEDFQPEMDWFHIFNNGHYLYTNYGIGIKHKLFPQHRIGIEYFFPFANEFEASFGGKYFIYENTNATVLTGHIAKYLANTWLSFRPYYTIKDGANSFASLFNMRMYAKNQISYTGLELGYGNSPDDRFAYTQPGGKIWLSAYKVKLERNISISLADELRFGLGYVYEEISDNRYRNRYLFEIILKHRF
ncbi:YaiO family outer membrane beta-barrel protein [Plebeiibacterium sediminum]|uniref:YaiO family outer membrane beta-barrel protein n=1 Tax=Plebeiibacterium sediminum TaxID=2992112 RepID=A0AAE3SE91_9BACT|nr:YaiO family outer membrane beta-barrel protein [Plebeiobacterium sediminum]MCW3786253.1 YaiO family outer membrane beta-barrel protein [Plebeiobacterium sediminum]